MLTQTFQTITHTLSSRRPVKPAGLSSSLGGSSWGEHAPLSQVGVQSVENAELLFRLKHQQLLQHLARVRSPDEASYVDMCEGGHQVLTVESIHDAAVAGDGVGKVFDFEGSLEAAGKEAAERSDERGEGREEDAVDLEGVQVHRFPSQCVL